VGGQAFPPESSVGAPNWIKNPENDPKRAAAPPIWIKNPENDPKWVVGTPNWIKNPENDPEREQRKINLRTNVRR